MILSPHKSIVLIVLLLGSMCIAKAQTDYVRSGISLMNLEYRDALQEDVNKHFYAYHLNEKFDNNSIPTQSIQAYGGSRIHTVVGLDGKKLYVAPDRSETLLSELNRMNVGREIVTFYYNRQPSGLMTREVLNARGAYNRTDQAVSELSATHTDDIYAGGEDLIKQSYIIIFDFSNLRYFEKGEKEGNPDYYWGVTPSIYLFQLDWSEELQYNLMNCWVDEETSAEERDARIQAFEQLDVPVKFVKQLSFAKETATGIYAFRKSSYKGNKTEAQLKNEAFDNLVESSLSQLMSMLEGGYDAFKVKSLIHEKKSANNIGIRIGKKEGVSTYKRFYVYETVMTRNNKTKQVRKGVIRATDKVTDNRTVASGKTTPTRFFQIAGKKIEEGMTAIERPSADMSIDIGSVVSGFATGLYLSFDMSFYSSPLTNFHLFIDTEYDNFFFCGLGAGWGLVMRNLELYPKLSYNVVYDTEKEESKGSYFNGGMRANINISYPVQLFLEGGYDLELDDIDNRYRTGPSLKLGLRFCL